MIELVKYDKKYLGNIILPINTKLKVENNKIVFKCSSYLKDRLDIESIDNRIKYLLSDYIHDYSKIRIEHDSTEEDYDLWNIYAMEKKRISIKSFSHGLNELAKEFLVKDDEKTNT